MALAVLSNASEARYLCAGPGRVADSPWIVAAVARGVGSILCPTNEIYPRFAVRISNHREKISYL